MTLQTEFRESIGSQFSLEADGVDRYRVRTPFMRDDGEHLVIVIVLKREQESWLFSDDGLVMRITNSHFGGLFSSLACCSLK